MLFKKIFCLAEGKLPKNWYKLHTTPDGKKVAKCATTL